MIGVVIARSFLRKVSRYERASCVVLFPQPNNSFSNSSVKLMSTWREIKNSQGRIYYEEEESGTRQWDRPVNQQVKSISEVEHENSLKVQKDVKIMKKPYNGDSIFLRAVDHFWTLMSVVRSGYWIAILAAAVYIGSELFKTYS